MTPVRVVSFAYTTFVDVAVDAVAADDAADVRWVPVEDVLSGLQPTAFDHARIIAEAEPVALAQPSSVCKVMY